ncbi:hypothetical protein [Paractinoplanes rishiriensis]|uniref:Uncharacterized protein n=1 Tax=Paractinoplanes rishiriensis TaxID=1050105 RepID=A0A919JVT4_9ACTN|nr:hypothetical protein [Actinoplanes rishiriensis]GIE95758.1 hypothetical protein Ari01nite_32230 [Actinoplanes rishiriensis]
MSENDAESWLTQQAQDLLEQGTFGLYELVWGMRGAHFGLTDAEAIALAGRVVRRLVDRGAAQIFAVSWPALEVIDGPLPAAVLDEPKSWSEGESGPMVGLVPAA